MAALKKISHRQTKTRAKSRSKRVVRVVGNQPKMEVEGFVLGGGLPAPWHVEEMTCDGDTNGTREPTYLTPPVTSLGGGGVCDSGVQVGVGVRILQMKPP